LIAHKAYANRLYDKAKKAKLTTEKVITQMLNVMRVFSQTLMLRRQYSEAALWH